LILIWFLRHLCDVNNLKTTIMKTLKILSLFLFTSLLLVSCKKDDDTTGGGSLDVGTLVAKVGGSNFSGDIVAIATETTAGGNTTIRLQASDATGKAMIILINGYSGTGTYEFSTASNISNIATYTEANISNPMNSKSWVAPYENSGVVGQVNFTEKTATTVKGTFNFKGKEQNGSTFKEITEGSFNLEFQ
jgi:hypothetical protein